MSACSNCTIDGQAANLTDPAFRRVLWAALAVNLVMFAIEFVASGLGDSVSLLADSLDFFGDAANYGISLLVIGMALHIRARAALIKAATMAAFGFWVIGSAVYRAYTGSDPDPTMMGGVALLALGVNVVVALMLYSHRNGDSNRRSIWLCSRNDAIGNIAVILAAFGVFASDSRWPDLIVAAVIASLSTVAAIQVIRMARIELRSSVNHGKSPVSPAVITSE